MQIVCIHIKGIFRLYREIAIRCYLLLIQIMHRKILHAEYCIYGYISHKFLNRFGPKFQDTFDHQQWLLPVVKLSYLRNKSMFTRGLNTLQHTFIIFLSNNLILKIDIALCRKIS